MRDRTVAKEAPALPGVIDSLSAGFGLVNRVLWVILFPIGLDVLLWRAPHLLIAPVVDHWLGVYNQLVAQYGGELGSQAGSPFDPQTLEPIRQLVGEFNLLSFLVSSPFYVGSSPFLPWNLAKAWVPTIVQLQQVTPVGVVEISRLLLAVGLVLALQLAGLLLGCTFAGFIGQQVRDGRVSLSLLGRRVWRYWLRVLGFILLLFGVTLALLIPLSVVVGVLSVVAPGIALLAYGLLALLVMVGEFWLLFYLFFLVDAIVVGELGPLAAARSSILVVRRHLGASMGLIALTLLISLGMQVIWTALAGQPWGLAAAIVGNGYIASGLLAASMLFYQSRAAQV